MIQGIKRLHFTLAGDMEAMMRFVILAAMLATGALVSSTRAQTTLDRPIGQDRPYRVDSGILANPAGAATILFRETVHIKGAAWMRVYFGSVVLAPGSVVRVTSALDGETQQLDDVAMAMWGNTSAYFNGDTMVVELIAGPKTANNRLIIDHLTLELGVAHPIGSCGICGSDDRVPSNQNWAGRLVPPGCSASVWNEESCLVSAGHCVAPDAVIEFNVPPSSPDCRTDHPPVADQFPVIEALFSNQGVGNDWAVMRTGTNNMGQTAFERYGQLRPIAEEPGQISETLFVWGYGIDSECELSQTQQTSTGTLMTVQPNHYTYDVDTTFGNSGSAVIRPHIRDGNLLAIVTHCDCPNNIGTRVDLPAFAAARAAMCPPPPDPCAADLDDDGTVGILDLLALLAAWGSDPGGPPDLDGDGTVGIADLLQLLADWGDCP
ncbi:MAG: hypothetical protein O7D97_04550 [Planctomycetota bacterium]|nr:hypothetical protein [Planctomycetota bacterium]